MTPLIETKKISNPVGTPCPRGAFRLTLFCVLLVLGIFLCLSGWSQAKLPDPSPHTSLKLPLKNPKIKILKQERKLYLYSDDKLLRRYSIALGNNPVGAKTKEGDGKTPEGKYFIVAKNPHSQFYLSLAINYPNKRDAKTALKNKIIVKRQYENISRADRQKRIPPWNTPLGGEIFIHGSGTQGDWTQGCIALDNPPMTELYQAVPIGTPVIIDP